MIKIQPDTLRNELSSIIELLDGWEQKISQGIPGDEIPASDDLNIEIFVTRLRGELMLAANRLTSLVEVLDE